MTTVLNSELNIYQLLPLIMMYSKDILRAEASSLFLLDEKEEYLYCEVAMGEKGDIIQQYLRLPLGSGIAGWVASHRKSLLIPNAYEDTRFNPEYDKKSSFRTKSLICVPLFVKDKLIGTLEVLNQIDGGAFEQDDLEILSVLADSAAVAIENARLTEGLRKRVLELSLLYEFEQILLTRASLSDISDWLLHKTLEHMEAKSGTIYRFNEETQVLTILAAQGIPKEEQAKIFVLPGKGIAGWVAQNRQPLLVPNLELDPRYDKNAKFKFESNSLISAPILSKERLLGVISINDKYSGYAFTPHDLTILETIAGRLASTLSNYELFQTVTRDRQEKKRAADLMKQVLPETIPPRNGLKIRTGYFPLENIGGDFYHIYSIEPHLTGILLADVTGHGISAALLSIMIHTILQSYARELFLEPGKLLTILNADLHNRMRDNFVTVFYALIDTQKNSITFANGGHSAALVVRDNNAHDVEDLTAKGKLLGFLPSLVFEQNETVFEPGDRLFLYTDGLLELAYDNRSCLLPEPSLRSILSETAEDYSSDLPKTILEKVKFNCPHAFFDDDISILIVDRHDR